MTINRRKFIRTGSLLAGGSLVLPTIIPSCAFGANDKINLGMIGTGDHGINWNLAAYLKLPDCRVVAACDVDASRASGKAVLPSYFTGLAAGPYMSVVDIEIVESNDATSTAPEFSISNLQCDKANSQCTFTIDKNTYAESLTAYVWLTDSNGKIYYKGKETIQTSGTGSKSVKLSSIGTCPSGEKPDAIL
ncbi:MAG: hypothetical protein HZB98_15240, partial [Bacteroidia bacterium]|nr:hypothetical protein [Bacteroidia bacterium]